MDASDSVTSAENMKCLPREENSSEMTSQDVEPGHAGGDVSLADITGQVESSTFQQVMHAPLSTSARSDTHVTEGPPGGDGLQAGQIHKHGNRGEGNKDEIVKAPLCYLEDTEQTLLKPNAASPKIRRTPKAALHEAVDKVHCVVKFTRLERMKRRARWLSKKLTIFVLSHIGVTTVVVLYVVLGGMLFQFLEQDNELTSKIAVRHLRRKYTEQLWNVTLRLNVLHPEVWSVAAHNILQQFEADIYRAVVEDGWDGTMSDATQVTKWTFPGALLFATTVVTTIGYGDIVPRTPHGRIVLIIYAIVGIPLTLLCIANVGQLLANLFRFLWTHSNNLCRKITCSTNDPGEKPYCSSEQVPISVCVIIMVAYILIGAALFSSWENNWTFLDGSYFCFVTLSTIGFGDYVPGQFETAMGNNERRVVCVLYLVVGLSLLAMVFQLMQESLTRWLARYASVLGLSKAQIDKDIEALKDDAAAAHLHEHNREDHDQHYEDHHNHPTNQNINNHHDHPTNQNINNHHDNLNDLNHENRTNHSNININHHNDHISNHHNVNHTNLDSDDHEKIKELLRNKARGLFKTGSEASPLKGPIHQLQNNVGFEADPKICDSVPKTKTTLCSSMTGMRHDKGADAVSRSPAHTFSSPCADDLQGAWSPKHALHRGSLV